MNLSMKMPFLRAVTLAMALPWSMVASAATIDVLVLYTPEAQTTTNGQDMSARIASYIAYANRAYSNSDVDMQLRAVHSAQLEGNYTYVTEGNLDSLRTNTQVQALRRDVGADMVVLLNLAQEVQGGYVCGIGYVPPGDPNSGQFYSYASSAAYSLVAINCGLSTFAHELGHNMGLGHSYRQNSGGGIWNWARGYGVDGLFSTIMAYPQSFGTRNQLQQFANPRQTQCGGVACGVDASRSDGADAALNLNRLGTQLANFVPTVVEDINDPIDEPSDPESPDEGGVACAADLLPGSILANGDFARLDGWASGFGASRLDREVLSGSCAKDVLVIADRQANYGSALQLLSDGLARNARYRLKAELRVRGASRETVQFALVRQTNRGTSYTYLDPVSVTSSEFTAYQTEFTAPSRVVGILIYGPAAGVDILVDNISLAR